MYEMDQEWSELERGRRLSLEPEKFIDIEKQTGNVRIDRNSILEFLCEEQNSSSSSNKTHRN